MNRTQALPRPTRSQSLSLTPFSEDGVVDSPKAAPVCLLHIHGQCAKYPDAAHWEWFDDAANGGPAQPSHGVCLIRARSWAQDCGSNSTVKMWHRGATEVLDSTLGTVMEAAIFPSCLCGDPWPGIGRGCSSSCMPGRWPTVISGNCSVGWKWAAVGVCYLGQRWQCPAGLRPLRSAPFCESPADRSSRKAHLNSLLPTLYCYAERYTDVAHFCRTNASHSNLRECSWIDLLQHYRIVGQKAGRQIKCSPTDLDTPKDRHFYHDQRYPNTLISKATANFIRNSKARNTTPTMRISGSGRKRKAILGGAAAGRHARISFAVCGGLLNQRIAIVDALIIGALLDATVLLPSLNLNGRQSGSDYQEADSQKTPFTTFFDLAATAAALPPFVRIDDEGESHTPGHIIDVQNRNYSPDWYRDLLSRSTKMSVPPHLRFGCTFLGVDHSGDEVKQLFWRINSALTPAAQVQFVANATISKLQRSSIKQGGGGRFTALHLRVESDWIEHCKRWENNASDPPRDNCMTNTDSLHRVFAIESVSMRYPLYVATEEEGSLQHTRGVSSLVDYSIHSKSTLWPSGHPHHQWLRASRELGAFHDLIVCAAAHRFIGNSVSTCAPRSNRLVHVPHSCA